MARHAPTDPLRFVAIVSGFLKIRLTTLFCRATSTLRPFYLFAFASELSTRNSELFFSHFPADDTVKTAIITPGQLLQTGSVRGDDENIPIAAQMIGFKGNP